MGPMSRNERWLVVILFAVMAGWVSSPWHPIPNAFVALTGVSALLLLRVITWDDLLDERKAWDALIWFSPLLMMADQQQRCGGRAGLGVKGLSEAACDGIDHSPATRRIGRHEGRE